MDTHDQYGDGEFCDGKAETMIVIRADERAPATARSLVSEAFRRWGLESDDARLVVSELATNAHLHGCTPGAETDLIVVRTWLRDDNIAVIEVWDKSEALPVRGVENYSSESGRGLLMIEQITRAWGARPLACGAGKIVWAALDTVNA
jgi:anti-sigma regulatory factor (Ser/Thr protein kinase)